MIVEDIEAAALSLEPRARARLASRLLDSLETLDAAELDSVWAEEAVRRNAAWDAGELETRSAEDVFRDARSRL